MKSIHLSVMRVMSVGLFAVLATAATATAQDARIKTAQLDTLSSKASQTVDVNLDERLMQFAAKFLNTKDPDEAAVKDMVHGLKGIHVKILEFEAEGQYTPADLEAIRSQVRNAPWNRIVGVRSKREGNVEVYLLMNGTQVGGLAILAFGPKELAVVNIVGPVDLDKLSKLEGNFGIPDLEIESQKTKPRNE
jgi:Domain of unknown function (DUF4252)